MKASLRICAQLRKPSIHFIGKRQLPTTPHAAHPHPFAPAEYQRVFTTHPSQAATAASPSTASKTSDSTAVYANFWEAPPRFWRGGMSKIDKGEINAIMSGGASAAQ